MSRLSCLLALLLFAPSAQAASFSFRHGPLELSFDEATGALLRIACGGAVLAEAGPERSPTSFGFGEKGAQTWLEQLRPGRQLLKHHQPSPDTLELAVRVGEFELVERYKLHADPPRLDRSATLINRGKETVKLRAFTFRTPGLKATPDGFYRFPCQWPPTSRPFAKMEPGRHRGGGLSTAPLIAQLAPNRSLLWASCTDDSPHVRVEERREGEAGEGEAPAEPPPGSPGGMPRSARGSAGASPSQPPQAAATFDVVQGVEAAGYLRPNQPQQIAFVSMMVADAGYWDALPKLWDWMDSVGIKVPADRPDWLKGAVLYSFHPGGTIGSNFTDLGGFKAATEYLLPTLPKLGVTAIWIMPVEWKGPYWPLDYYRLQDGLGTAEELKALIRRAHELGLKVLMDIVPHGGAPQAVHNQAHPEFMLRREDGSTLTYWLNDFARPDWQDFIAKVAEHFIREYDADGFRIDACYGSHELNWDPAVPYARASLSGLAGGLAMTKRIRDVVRKLKPKDGAVLAEVESVRHAAVSDFQYDFNLCYNVLHAWRRMPAAEFVPYLQDYLEEQKYVYPRGTLFLRHIESHDSLRAQGWYGVEGLRALYALTAWIDGVPLIYHDMETGHGLALKWINEVRSKQKLELSRGDAFYRAVQRRQPGVFSCLRTLGKAETEALINLNRYAVDAEFRGWTSAEPEKLAPLAYCTLFTPSYGATPEAIESVCGTPETLAFGGAKEWYADTVEGRLQDEFRARHRIAAPVQRSPIYWRAQGTRTLWQNETVPLRPALACLGARRADGGWINIKLGPQQSGWTEVDGDLMPLYKPWWELAERVRLEEKAGDYPGLEVLGLGKVRPTFTTSSTPPRAWTGAVRLAESPRLRCVGPDYIVSAKHFTCVLRRQGGVIRELFSGDKVVAKDQDLYGDQEYFHAGDSSRIAAGNDVESGIRIWKADDGLHLAFDGQLRGFGRFDLKRPPLWYRNEYVFTDAPRFKQKWAFRTEKSFKDRTAFLAAIVQLPAADRFRFLHDGKALAEDVVGEGGPRRGDTKGKPAPERIELLAGGKLQLSLTGLKTPSDCAPNVFLHDHQFFITLLDGKGAVMQEGKWYEFEVEWRLTAGD